ncbi:hypothetical protein ACFSWE_15030 [Leucobacter albus]|uniref:DUF2231 domain-containing protein n=1 Tax=Leucobacter albus TaxID=272210 RepID=A0ABW3TQA0_9MICO
MHSDDATGAVGRAVRVRERISLALMLLPLAGLLAFLMLRPAVWATNLAVFFDGDGNLVRSDAGWMLSVLALAAATLCAWVGAQGLRAQWKVNRRWQRGFLGSIAAVLVTLVVNSWTMTQAIDAGGAPNVGCAILATLAAMLYGVVCAWVSPPDSEDVWAHTFDGDRDAAAALPN